MCNTLFLVDSMMGNTLKWLRILGCDSAYVPPDLSDDLAIKLAKESGRVLITKDSSLVQRAVLRGVRSLYIEGDSLEDELARISADFDIDLKIRPDRTRCPFCNEKLKLVDRKGILDRKDVPRAVIRSHKRFLVCPSCGKLFWFGTHYWEMLRTLAKVKMKKEDLTELGGR